MPNSDQAIDLHSVNGNARQAATTVAPSQDVHNLSPEHIEGMLERVLSLGNLQRYGRQFAVSKCVTETSSEDTRNLSEYAEGHAAKAVMPDYDPASFSQDKLEEDDQQRLLREMDQAQLARNCAQVSVGERKAELAQLGSRPVQPELSPWGVFFTVAALVLTLAPTAHDRIFYPLKDELLIWACSTLSAGVIAAFIAWAILGRSHLTPRRNALNWSGLIIGIGIGLGFFVLRISEATTLSEWLFAIGLTVFEWSAVTGLEVMASHLREDHASWLRAKAEFDRAEAQVKTAAEELQQRKQTLAEFESRRSAHHTYVAERWMRCHKAADLLLAAKKAILQGYAEGIAENKGRLLGWKGRAS